MSVERAGERGSQGGGCDMSGHESDGIVGDKGRRESEVAKGEESGHEGEESRAESCGVVQG